MHDDDFSREAISAIKNLINQQIVKRGGDLTTIIDRVNELDRKMRANRTEQFAINGRITTRLVGLESQFGNELCLRGPGTAFDAGYREALRDMIRRGEDDEGSIFSLANGLATLQGIDITDTPDEAASSRRTP